uniref:Uncharacterized protein n=1 Tax=Corethron hystrix TaxID=216773 RepID=A0A7S1BEV2_9STRA
MQAAVPLVSPIVKKAAVPLASHGFQQCVDAGGRELPGGAMPAAWQSLPWPLSSASGAVLRSSAGARAVLFQSVQMTRSSFPSNETFLLRLRSLRALRWWATRAVPF